MIRSPKPSNPPILDLRRVGFPTSFAVVSKSGDRFRDRYSLQVMWRDKLEINCWLLVRGILHSFGVKTYYVVAQLGGGDTRVMPCSPPSEDSPTHGG